MIKQTVIISFILLANICCTYAQQSFTVQDDEQSTVTWEGKPYNSRKSEDGVYRWDYYAFIDEVGALHALTITYVNNNIYKVEDVSLYAEGVGRYYSQLKDKGYYNVYVEKDANEFYTIDENAYYATSKSSTEASYLIFWYFTKEMADAFMLEIEASVNKYKNK